MKKKYIRPKLVISSLEIEGLIAESAPISGDETQDKLKPDYRNTLWDD